MVSADPPKYQWEVINVDRPDGLDKAMMLNTDMCLAYNENTVHQLCMKEIGFAKGNFRRCCKQRKVGRGQAFLNAAHVMHRSSPITVRFSQYKNATTNYKWNKIPHIKNVEGKSYQSNYCCAWWGTDKYPLFNKIPQPIKKGDMYCGKPYTGFKRKNWDEAREKVQCCNGANVPDKFKMKNPDLKKKWTEMDDCDSADWPMGWGFDMMARYV